MKFTSNCVYGRIIDQKFTSNGVYCRIIDQKITISEKELTDGMLKYASQYPGQEKQIFDYFKQNPSSIESIKGPIFAEKIIFYIMSKVNKKNKKIDVKEFEKLLKHKLSQIFDVNSPFIETDDKNNCKFCSYKKLCAK